MVLKRLFFFGFFLFLTNFGFGQSVTYSFREKIDWQAPHHFETDNGITERPYFTDAVYPGTDLLPYFVKNYPIHSAQVSLLGTLTPLKTVALTPAEVQVLVSDSLLSKNDTSFYYRISKSVMQKQPYATTVIMPIRWNTKQQHFEKLIEYRVDVNVTQKEEPDLGFKNGKYADNSVLSSGQWIKIRIDKDGIYKLTYDDLKQMGLDVNANPQNIAVFGNGGGMLPEKNDVFRYDDLVENPIYFSGDEDGVFNPDDYLLFYGKGPVLWKFDHEDAKNWVHVNNIYDDYAYYFITVLDRKGKRIETAEAPAGNADVVVTDFIDRQFHEKDESNLAGTGRLWVGEYFDFDNSKTFTFTFPNLVKNKKLFYHGRFVAVSSSSSKFKTYANQNLIATTLIPSNPADGYNFGKTNFSTAGFLSDRDDVDLKIEYIKFSNSAVGYLDYLELSAFRQLIMTGSQMQIRNEFKNGNIAEYHLQGENLTIWDVTSPVNVKKVDAAYSNGQYLFKTNIEDVKQFLAFNGQEFYKPEFVENVDNQNLHAIKNIDYLIITHPNFLSQAEQLAAYHETNDNLKTKVVLVQKIYNEFSSGAQDITGIRDFVKMIYDKSDEGKELKYLLLFGDASYDYKDRISGNTNFVPCWESEESLNILHSIATDDYFGFLDDGEGSAPKDLFSNDKVDIGIGRLPVDTPEQADEAINKIKQYSSLNENSFGPWRNIITFIADDGNFNIHLKDAEKLANYLEDVYPEYNIDKIYLDGFKQISTPSGQQAPEVNQAINNRIEKGTLIFNYSGHGGELGLAHEQILKLGDINSWKNFNKLSVFITATCEFSRYDDPKRVSAGEQVFLNPNGGGIALFSTSRATYAAANYALNKAIYTNNLFEKTDGEYPSFGDVIRRSKVVGSDNDRKFVLLGDPAVKLAYTDYTAKTLKVNQTVTLRDKGDTLKAFQHAYVQGEIVDNNNQLLNDFNGIIYPTVYDKRKEVITFGDESSPYAYTYWSNILFNGKASIKNGRFEFEFVVPKDIGYNFGTGRISYYLHDDEHDGNGYYENIVIGGYDQNAEMDDEGPIIKLYLNDSLFVSGDITDENPELYAIVEDENGINTTGNGIGHDIVATIDNNPELTFILNDYYESFLNRFNKGSIRFPFRNLEEGEHSLSLKVWDVYNNSSTAEITFKVVHSNQTVIENLLNFPNPFTEKTTFSFSHNQQGKDLMIRVDIYSITGKIVKSLDVPTVPSGYVSRQISWDGKSDAGDVLPSGIYPYKVTIKNELGKVASQTGKLVIIR